MYRVLFLFLVFNVWKKTFVSSILEEDSVNRFLCVIRPKDFFLCDNRKCINKSIYRCNGFNDCGDNSDENDCEDFKLSPSFNNCTKYEFQCRNKFCIPIIDFCNAQEDCIDGSDEYVGCETVLKQIHCSGFQCKNGTCIKNNNWHCDGTKDCSDGSDESNCGVPSVTSNQCNATFNRYLCNNTRCIPLNLTCDGNDDCGDGSDENCEHLTKNCTNLNCEHLCKNTPRGPICFCRPGFEMNYENFRTTCVDVDECKIYGICSHFCKNLRGKYFCSCENGYISHKSSCTQRIGHKAKLLLSTRETVRELSLELNYTSTKIYYARNIIATSEYNKYIYWCSNNKGVYLIFRKYSDGNPQIMLAAGLREPVDFSVDYRNGNIFFVDSFYKYIAVCSKDGYYCTVIISENTQVPKGIVLNQKQSLIYWSSCGDRSSISVAKMNGEDKKIFVKDDLNCATQLTIDISNERLYWIDIVTIESITLDGTDRRKLLKDFVARYPTAIAVYEDSLYFADSSNSTLYSCNKFTGKNLKTYNVGQIFINDIHIAFSWRPFYYNDYYYKENLCSQLFIPLSNRKYSCACNSDYELSSDNKTCIASWKHEHIIIGDVNKLISYYQEMLGTPIIKSNPNLNYITNIAYDSITDNILVADQLTNSLFSFNWSSSNVTKILEITNQYLGGMDFDYAGNNLYWSNTEFNAIEIYSMKTESKLEIPFINQPYEIALVPEKGNMFVVFKTKTKEYYIQKLDMSGKPKSKKYLETGKLMGPKISLAYDFKNNRLYYADEGSGQIDSISDQGTDRMIFRTGLRHIVSIALMGDFIYWTEQHVQRLFWANKTNTADQTKLLLLNYEYLDQGNWPGRQLTHLHKRFLSNHDCSKGSPCSHICITTDEFQCHDQRHCIMKSHVCNGYIDCYDSSDEFNCSNFSCNSEKFKCTGTGLCIPKHWECDGEIDCLDGSDESEKCKSLICSPKMFGCENGNCIDKLLLCNGFNDCGDNSDEEHCINFKKVDPVNCNATEYKCERNETCIPENMRCNGKIDCPHGDDEKNCIQCEKSEFKCDNLQCIYLSLVCDARDDCGDNSDETNCGIARQANNSTSSCEEYKCDDGVCISYNKVCNKIYDCNDKSDEQGQCESSCNMTSCEQICIKTPKGSVCQCAEGYKLQEDEKSCKDIDECQLGANLTKLCSQICINSPGSYKCDCYKGYKLRNDEITCKSTDLSMKFIIASNEGIKNVSLGGIATEIIVPDMNDEISGLDVNIAKNAIYWSNENIKTVSRLNLTTGERKEIFFQNPDRLAVDWSTDNVYVYSKTSLASIEVCNLDKGTCANVISLNKVGNVFALIVDSVNGWIFWSHSKQTSYSKSEIYRAELTGMNPVSIIKSRVTIVSGLAIDHERSRLYWCDILLRVIESSDFYGNDRKLVYENDVYHPMQLNIFEDHLYWLSGISEKIQKCPLFKSDLEECEIIDTGMSDIHKFFIIMQKSRQPFVKDRCAERKCDYMCVSMKDNSTCICENGHLVRTNETCTSRETELTIINNSKPTKYYSRREYIYIGVVPLVIIFLGLFLYKFYFKGRFSNVTVGSLLERFNISNRTNNENLSQDHDRELRQVGSEFENPMFQDEQSPSLPRSSEDINSEGRNLINKD